MDVGPTARCLPTKRGKELEQCTRAFCSAGTRILVCGHSCFGQRSLRLQKKARHFDDRFWLHLIADAPQLYCIQNPAAHSQMDEDVFATGFIIHEDSWREGTRND